MSGLFSKILNMSFTSCFVILFVLLARLPLKKAPKIFSYALWSVVLFRLVCPFSFESVLSLIPKKSEALNSEIIYNALPKIETPPIIPDVNNVLGNPAPAPTPINPPVVNPSPIEVWSAVGTFLWALGIILLLAYSAISLIKLVCRLKSAKRIEDGVYSSDRIETPFVIGIFRPRIYLPENLSEEEKRYILLHEKTHIKRFDHLIKIIGFLVLCLHWFNPLAWLSFFLCGKDMEMSCDEAVIKAMGGEIKKDYSSSLLSLATGKRIVSGTPLAFGEGDTKGRIKNVLSYKKPTVWVIAAAVVLVIALSIGLIANPISVSRERAFRGDSREIATRFFEESWAPDYQKIESENETIGGESKLFSADITNDGRPEIFILCDDYNGSQVFCYDISRKDALLLGGFPASSIYGEEPLTFELYNGGGKNLLYTERVIEGTEADGRKKTTEVFASVKRGKLAKTYLERIENPDKTETSYFCYGGGKNEERAEITKEEYSGKKSRLLRNMAHIDSFALGEENNIDRTNREAQIKLSVRRIIDGHNARLGDKYSVKIDSTRKNYINNQITGSDLRFDVNRGERLDDRQFLKNLDSLSGYLFNERDENDFVYLDFKTKPKEITAKYFKGESMAGPYDCEITKDGFLQKRYRVPTPPAGEYKYIVDITWKDNTTQTAYFKIVVQKDVTDTMSDDYGYSIMSAGPNDFAPNGCEYGVNKNNELTTAQMIEKLDGMHGHYFDEVYASDGYVKIQYPKNEERFKKIDLSYCQEDGVLKEYPIDKERRIKIPTEFGVYNFFADITWDNGETETAFFRITVQGSIATPEGFTRAILDSMVVERNEEGKTVAKMTIPEKFPEGFGGKNINVTFMYNGPSMTPEDFGSFLNQYDLLENGVEAGKTYTEVLNRELPVGTEIYKRIFLEKDGEFTAESEGTWVLGDDDGDGKIRITDEVIATGGLDGGMDVQLVMVEGEGYFALDSHASGKPYHYDGQYELRVTKNGRIISSLGNRDLSPMSSDGKTLSFSRKFDLTLADYNGDGNKDFALSQFCSDDAMEYMFFSVDSKGKLSVLKFKDYISDSAESFIITAGITDNNIPDFSPKFEKLTDNSFKASRYDSVVGDRYIFVATWNGKLFEIKKKAVDNYGSPYSVIFPAYDQRTEANKEVFDIPPFETKITLPDAWTIRPMKDNPNGKYVILGLWNHLGIYNEQGKLVGSIGYNKYKEYEGAEEAPPAIYCGIAIGNHYMFDAYNAYQKVMKTDGGYTATTKVYISRIMAEQLGYEGDYDEIQNLGILSYDKNMLVYVAVELDSTALGEDELLEIARSITLSPTETKPGGNI